MTSPTTLLTLALLAAVQTQNQTAKAPPPPATTTFHSDTLHLDYTYPKSLESLASTADEAMKEEQNNETGALKAAVSCITLPLMAADSTGGMRMVLIMRLDGVCLGTTTPVSDLGAVATSGLTESLKRFGDLQVGKPTTYEVMGHSASAIFGTVKSVSYGMTFYGGTSCLLQGKDVLCWEFVVSDCAQLSPLMSYPAQFDGKTAEPLIPANLAPACEL